MGQKKDTKKKILDIAESLLQSRGFHAFSYHHIASQLGVKNAAIHYHFPSKIDLAVAIVARYRHRFERWSETLDKDQATIHVRFDAYLDICRYFIESGKICVLGMMAAEFNTMDERVQDEIEELQNQTIRWFTGVLEQGRDSGVFRFPGEASQKAMQLACLLQGAMLFAQVRDAKAFEQVVEQIKAELFLEKQSPQIS